VIPWTNVSSAKEEPAAGPEAVPAELVGREVSVRLLGPCFEAAAKRRIRPETLARGTGYSLEHLRDRRERIAWTAFMTFVENIRRAYADDDALVALGGAQLEHPTHRALLVPGRLLFTLAEIYRWGAGPRGPLAQLLVVHDITIDEPQPGKLHFDVMMKPGYTCTEAFWLLRLGFLRSVPRAFGLPRADVTLTVLPNGARYVIDLPAETGLLRRVRQRASWLFAARDAATELRKANDDLHERYMELRREVEARKVAEAKLQALNAELERRVDERTRALADANVALGMFSAAVAHDLRAPLRAMTGFANALLEDHGERLEPDAKRQLGRVIGNAVRMSELLEALLLLARISRADVHRQSIDIAAIARGVIDELRAADPAREVEVAVDPELAVDGDPALVRSLMQNLVGNAWKFTRGRSPARIEITREATAPGEVFRVRDNGAGFDMQHAAGLFAPFKRLHAEREFEGTGMGLAIVDRIVRRHGGRIWAMAQPGEGATFSFTLRP
jgi:signal transduction histidine kinase